MDDGQDHQEVAWTISIITMITRTRMMVKIVHNDNDNDNDNTDDSNMLTGHGGHAEGVEEEGEPEMGERWVVLPLLTAAGEFLFNLI